ncbi:beta-lactamase family protein [Oscillochloris sp. ZM17-4]|uniref:serine hydrolase domain-containing protein n=1 Tax=Oscillochloris sp. ZM17-4 TaxID=2866714 RepID=UPI001C72C317|nr:serine hydrolase domain-containing protein [Oscillochloris sp. ZM17-4]MBX0326082.1 beta-lactamase family protein [Oscillochloris sp. ZM17-4]
MLSDRIDALAHAAIDAGVFPGCVVYAQRAGRAIHHAAYGTTMYRDPGSLPVGVDTVYDIASLTKVVTFTAALALVDAGQIGLDDPVARFLPAMRAAGVTVRHLLTHSSGLDIRLSALRERGAAAIRAAAYALEPARTPGSHTMYANVSSLLLGDVVAAAFGAPLDVAVGELVIGPLDMANTGYCPPEGMRSRIAPSEWDEGWRGGLVHGVAHDESAYALGGVAGHAGLFSNAADLGRLAAMWLQGGAWAGRQILRESTVALACRDHTGHMASPSGMPLRSGLGWARDRPNYMGAAPEGTIGHTGFTGTAIVILPRHQTALVFLSNRTYPRRTPPPFPHHAAIAGTVAALIAP